MVEELSMPKGIAETSADDVGKNVALLVQEGAAEIPDVPKVSVH